MVADSDAVLGSGDKKNPTFQEILPLTRRLGMYSDLMYVPFVVFGRVGSVSNRFALV